MKFIRAKTQEERDAILRVIRGSPWVSGFFVSYIFQTDVYVKDIGFVYCKRTDRWVNSTIMDVENMKDIEEIDNLFK